MLRTSCAHTFKRVENRTKRLVVTGATYTRRMAPEKVCKRCGVTKPLDQFYGDSAARDRHRPECKACTAAQRKAWYEGNRAREIERVTAWQRANGDRVAANRTRRRQRPEVKAKERGDHLRRTHGITIDDYEAMVVAQKGRCCICGRRPAQGKSFHIDHDHVTNRIRGLLCGSCNYGLGLFAESPARLQRAAAYVTRPSRHRAAVLRRLDQVAAGTN